MECKQIREELSAYIDGMLGESLLSQVEAHLSACPGCAAEAEELREVVGMVRSLGDIAPPGEFRAQVMAGVKGGEAALTGREKPGSAGAAGGGAKRFARWGQLTAVAAVLVLGIGISILWGKGMQTGLPSYGGVGSAPDMAKESVVETKEKSMAGIAGVREDSGNAAFGAKDTAKSQANSGLADSAGTAGAAGASGNPGAPAGNDAIKSIPIMPKYSLAPEAIRGKAASRSEGIKGVSDSSARVISEGTIRIDVSDTMAAVAQVEKIAAGLGGKVEKGAVTTAATTPTLRLTVAGKDFDRAVSALTRVGIVIDKQVGTRDVSRDYSDLEARISGLEMKANQLKDLAKNTVSPVEKATVEADLSRTEGELSGLRQELAQLDSAIGAAVIVVEINLQGQ